MAANISTNQNGASEVFTAGAPAWHKLGANVKDAQSWEAAMQLANLNWTISKKQMANPVTGDPVPVWALVRDDDSRFLSSVGNKYTPIQNKDAFTFVDALVGQGQAHYETAGALGNGETIWCMAQLGNGHALSFEPVAGDTHYSYLLFTDSRDGGAAQVRLTTVRVVCQNTLSMAMGSTAGRTVLRLRHTSGIADKLAAAAALTTQAQQELTTLNARLAALATKKLKRASFTTIMERLFPEADMQKGRAMTKAAAIAELFEDNDGNAFPEVAHTGYALYNAYTNWIDHERDGLRTGTRDLATVRAESAMFGAGDQLKRSALNIMLDTLDIAPLKEVDVSAEIAALTA